MAQGAIRGVPPDHRRQDDGADQETPRQQGEHRQTGFRGAGDDDGDGPGQGRTQQKKVADMMMFTSDQSIANGLISTTTPVMPTAAAIQRRKGMASRRNSSDSGTTQIVVVLARMAMRPA